MAKLVWSLSPRAIHHLGQEEKTCPLSKEELLRLGIPARKIARVQEELARLAGDDALDPSALPSLACALARQFL